MPETEYDKLAWEWRQTVMNRLDDLGEKMDRTRQDVMQMTISAVKVAEIEELWKRIRELEEKIGQRVRTLEDFKTKAVQTILVVQVAGFIGLTLIGHFWK